MVIMRYEDGRGDIWEWDVNPFTRKPIIPADELEEIREILLDDNNILLFWNAKFDLFMFEFIGIVIPFKFDDGNRKIEEVSWMARCINNLEYNFKLKYLATKYLGIDTDDETILQESVAKARFIAKKLGWTIATKESASSDKPAKADYWLPKAIYKHIRKVKSIYPNWKKRLEPIIENACNNYGLIDGDRTIDLYNFYSIGMTENNLWKGYANEMELLPYTMDMERQGIRIDKRRMIRIKKECQEKADAALKRLQAATTIENFNPNASMQVCEFVYNGNPLNLEVLKRTKKTKKGGGGNPSTDAEALVGYSTTQSLVGDIFTYKACTKAISTFFNNYDKFSEIIDCQMIVHPGLNQAGALTWRYTCEKPNLQQVSSPETTNSRAKDFIVDIRQVFRPRNNYLWLLPDYSQVEVILFADIYGVKTMLDAIKRGEDVHEATANAVWGGKDNDLFWRAAEDIYNKHNRIPSLDQMAKRAHYKITEFENMFGSKNYRKLAKTVTFCNTYGGTYNVLMSWLGITAHEAKKIIVDYFNAFPDMKEKMNEQEERGRQDGYIITKFGTRLAVDKWAAYKIVNHEIQHSAGMLLKMGMRKCGKWLKENDIAGRLAMTVHDENIFEMLIKEYRIEIARKLRDLMSDHEGIFSVPTPVTMDIVTERWSIKEKLKL